MTGIKRLLDRFYKEDNFKEKIPKDPIEFPLRHRRKEDIEVSGLIASCFAYGRVDLFKPVIDKILSGMGKRPSDFLKDFSVKKHGRLFDGIRYRFNKDKDIVCLIYAVSETLKRHGSLENAFKSFYSDTDLNTGNAISAFVDCLTAIDTKDVYGKNIKPGGFLQFFPSPKKGSACKRMNLFLRWMIRDKDIDFGIWKGIPKNKLIIPLDVHIARISRCLGFTKRKTQDWKTAVEITEALKRLDPEDPLKYDFALCHYGIAGLCGTAAADSKCKKGCIFKGE